MSTSFDNRPPPQSRKERAIDATPRGFTRRRFMAAAAGLSLFAQQLWAMDFGDDADKGAGSVSLTPTAFVVNGRPRFLAAGTIDYFRCPAALWRDRILKVKRAGLNTIMTYIAWNQHEPREGSFLFDGDADLGRFLKICAELDMMAIVRTGPFICDEFEMVGHPAWLLSRPGIALREPSRLAEPYIERWFERLCREIAPLQVSHGGPIILVQAENEYHYPERPGALEYLRFLYQTLRRNDIVVPITACGNGQEVQAPGYFETYNGYSSGAVVRFRKEHASWPLLISEHYTDWFDVWTWPPTDFPKRMMLEQQSIAALSQGVMLSYFCFHGGTNFGFNGSSTWKSDHSWVTNRYYGQGPVAEGGAVNPNYFAVKAASSPIQQFEDFFASTEVAPSPFPISGPVTMSALKSGRGMLVFVHPAQPISADERVELHGEEPVSLVENRGTSDVDAAAGEMILPSGQRVELASGSAQPMMLPWSFRIDERHVIDYANASLLGLAGNRERQIVFLRGEAGRKGLVSIDGHENAFTFHSQEPVEITEGEVKVFALGAALADRTWFADGRVLIGPAYVGEKAGAWHECLVDAATQSVTIVEAIGEIHRHTIPMSEMKPLQTRTAAPLIWTGYALQEMSETSEGWKSIDTPRSVEDLGEYYGYCWYRARVSSSAERRTGLLFTAAADRAHVWVNGKYSGVYGRGANAAKYMLPVCLPAGDAAITILVDNMGRSSEGSTLQRKGIFDPVYAGSALEELSIPPIETAKPPENPSWQFLHYRHDAGTDAVCTVAEWTIHAAPGRGMLLALRELAHFAWIYWNGELLGEHHGDAALLDGFTASEFVLPALEAAQARLRMCFMEPAIRTSDDPCTSIPTQSKRPCAIGSSGPGFRPSRTRSNTATATSPAGGRRSSLAPR